jgi:WhiB family transcriptional regulator, redox-sensing transcriptional regulator
MRHTPYTANLSTGPAPVDPLWWREFGACAKVDPDLFYVERGETSRTARAVCKTCDPGIKAECLAYALANNEKFGIWGGTSERERRKLRSQAKANGTRRGNPGRTRTLVAAEPFRAALLALMPDPFPTRRGMSDYVSRHASLPRRCVSDFLDRDGNKVILEWAVLVCVPLGIDPAQLWPEAVAA